MIDELNVPGFVTVRKMSAVPGQQDVAAVEGGEGEVVRVAAAADVTPVILSEAKNL